MLVRILPLLLLLLTTVIDFFYYRWSMLEEGCDVE